MARKKPTKAKKGKAPKRLRVVGNDTTQFEYVVEAANPNMQIPKGLAVTVRKETQKGKGKGKLRKFKSKWLHI